METYVNISNMQTNNRGDKMSLKDYISITIVALAFMLITGIAKADEYKGYIKFLIDKGVQVHKESGKKLTEDECYDNIVT